MGFETLLWKALKRIFCFELVVRARIKLQMSRDFRKRGFVEWLAARGRTLAMNISLCAFDLISDKFCYKVVDFFLLHICIIEEEY